MKLQGSGRQLFTMTLLGLVIFIVHPDRRGIGIGRLITQNLIYISKLRKCETIYLIATMGAPVYHKMGFVTETEYLFFKALTIGKPTVTSVYIEPYRGKFKEQVAIINKLNSGEDRMFRRENHLEHGSLYCKNKTVEGFYSPTFGEGLIIVNMETAGIELLKLHLSFNNKVAFPKENLAAIKFLYDAGFKEIRTAKRMRLGKERNVNLANIYNRIAGNIG